MSLGANRRVICAKIESVYGTDPVPTGSDAMLVEDLDVSPMESSVVERNPIRGFFGQNERLMSETFSKVSFSIELGGHAEKVKGVVPKIASLLRACGFVGSQATSALSIVRTSTTATATLVDHGLAVGDKVSISGATQSEYNGTQIVTTVADDDTFTFEVSGAPATPATGSPVMKTAYNFVPISTAIPSVTFYYFVDGVLHKVRGAKGTFSLDIAVKTIPKFKFEFTGLYTEPVDASLPTPDISAFTIPQVANTLNTTDYSLMGYEGALESLGFSLGNVVNYITLIGREYVEVLDRKVSGNMSFEAPLIADQDFFTSALEQETGALEITHGNQNGNKVQISCPRVLLDSPKYKEENNVMMITCGVSIMPDDGNDEVTISFK